MLRPGDTLDNRYRLDELIARGGMSEVWRGTDTVLGRTVAVKTLPPALLSDEGFSARFRTEARLMAALHHPGIADVYDCGECTTPGGVRAIYLVMEYVDGKPLSHLLADGGTVEPAQVMSIVAQAGDALQAAHDRGVVHRDVKPGNLLVRADGSVILVDFGVARSTAATRITGTNAVVGTALYMAPEQASGRPISPGTDVYSLGATAYHLLAGRPPFSGDNPLQVALKHLQDEPEPLPDTVPAPVRAVVERALAKQPGDRYPSAAALAAAARGAGAAPVADAALLPTLGSAATTPVPGVGVAGVTGHHTPDGGFAAWDGLEETGIPATVREAPAGAEEGPPSGEPDSGRRGPRRRWALAGGAAALVAVLLGLTAMLRPDPEEVKAPVQGTSPSVSRSTGEQVTSPQPVRNRAPRTGPSRGRATPTASPAATPASASPAAPSSAPPASSVSPEPGAEPSPSGTLPSEPPPSSAPPPTTSPSSG